MVKGSCCIMEYRGVIHYFKPISKGSLMRAVAGKKPQTGGGADIRDDKVETWTPAASSNSAANVCISLNRFLVSFMNHLGS